MELEQDIKNLTNFKYLEIPTSYNEGYSTQKPIETTKKFRTFNPNQEWYKKYLLATQIKLLQILNKLRKEQKEYQTKILQDQLRNEAEVFTEARKKRAAMKLIDILKLIM